jgi:hypothetical protein
MTKRTLQGDVFIVTRASSSGIIDYGRTHQIKQACYTLSEALDHGDLAYLLKYEFTQGLIENRRLIKSICKYKIQKYLDYRLAQTKCFGSLAFTLEEGDWISYYAARFNHLDLIQWLIQQNMIQFTDALEGAYRGAHRGMISFLKDSCAKDVSYTRNGFLAMACRSGDLDLVREFNTYNKTAFNATCEYGHVHILDYFNEKYPQETFDHQVLYYTCKRGHRNTKAIIAMIYGFCDTSNLQEVHYYALMGAAFHGDIDLIEYIFDDNLDCFDFPSYEGIFIGACKGNKVHVIQYLIDKDYMKHVEYVSDGLEVAYRRGSLEVVEFLCQKQLIVLKDCITNYNVWDVLTRGNVKMIELFLSCVDKRDVEIALESANVFNNAKIIDLVINHSNPSLYDALSNAIVGSRFALVHYIIQKQFKNQDVSFWNNVLHSSMTSSNIRSIQYILRQGASDIQGAIESAAEWKPEGCTDVAKQYLLSIQQETLPIQ